MQIESILIFIAFVVLSSFANRRKEAQHKQRQQQKRQTQTKPTQATQQKQQKPGKRTLQDLFREMQQEMESEYKKVTELTGDRKNQEAPTTQKKAKPAATFTYESTDPRIDAPSARTLKEKKPIKPSFVSKKSTVYEDEIKDQSVEVGFNMTEEAILNGIIFSEVIGKPKAMQ